MGEASTVYGQGLRGMVQEQRKNAAGATPASAPSRSPRVVLHVDLDAFFVQVERKLNPTLIGVCGGVQLLRGCWLCSCVPASREF